MMRFLLLVLALSAVGLLGLAIDAHSRVPIEHPPFPVEPQRIFATGRVEGMTQEIELRPQFSGRIDEIPVHEGQWVEKGDLLIRLDDDQLRCEVAGAAAEHALAKAQLDRLRAGSRREEREEAAAMYRAKKVELDQAQITMKRYEHLRQSGAVTAQDSDNRRTSVAALQAEAEAAKARQDLAEAPPQPDEIRIDEARVLAAQARLDLAKVQKDRASLRSPIRAQVLKVEAHVGEIAGPASPQPAMILADTSRFRVRAYVEEIDAPKVRAGMAARVLSDGLPGKEFRGRVVRFSPRMDRKELWSDQPSERYDTKVREVWVDLDEGKDLVVGLRVDVIIDLTSHG
jgi:multidrug resistance efflux pump